MQNNGDLRTELAEALFFSEIQKSNNIKTKNKKKGNICLHRWYVGCYFTETEATMWVWLFFTGVWTEIPVNINKNKIKLKGQRGRGLTIVLIFLVRFIGVSKLLAGATCRSEQKGKTGMGFWWWIVGFRHGDAFPDLSVQ